MKIQGRYQTQMRCIFTFMLALFISGCGGGGGGDTTSNGGSTALSIQADSGDIIGIRVGETANLDGSASSTTFTSQLSYAWSFTHKPAGSKAVLVNSTLVNPSFVPDVVGTYMIQLVVSVGGVSSQRAIALVEASITGNVTGDVRVHTSFSSQCSTCHDGRFSDANVNPGLIIPKSGSHAGTTNMCQACHTTFGFNLIRYVDHTEVFGNCSTCHNGVDAIGKSKSHVITTGECNDCHNTTSFLQLDTNGNYDHIGITSGCVTCHNGKTAIGINHNPDTFDKSNNDCVFCHNTTTFTGAFPDHSVILTNVIAGTERCDSCHGSTAQGVKVGHPDMSPSGVDCGTCHSVKQFSLGGVYNHRVDAAVLSCESCHNDNNSINARGKSAISNHVVTTSDCGVCHGVGGGDFAFGTLDHSEPSVVAQQCDSCHGSTATGKPSPNHMSTTLDCGSCHTPGNFATGVFDHDPAVVDPVICSSCHDGVITAGKHVTHIPTADDCRVCHTDTTSFTGATVDHSTITNNCVSCHDGKISKGKGLNHQPTTRDCSDCHTTTPLTFIGGTFDHVGVTTCASCHDGVIAIDKSTKVNHIPAKKECSECHSSTLVPDGFKTSTFIINVHPSLSNGCEGCHTAQFLSARPALLKGATHVPTSQDCHFCHSNSNFSDPTQFTHDGITGNCESCHDGSYFDSANAKGKTYPVPTKTHPVTTTDCGACHGIGNGFTDGGFDHSGTIDNCSSCHGETAPPPPTGAVTRKSSMTNPAHVTTTQDCSICHVPGTFLTAVFNHDQIINDCVSCHGGTSPTATVKPLVGHVDTVEDCFVCHNTTAFAGAKYDHTGIVSNCASCHDGVIALGKDGLHVPTSKDCSVCHQTTGFIPGTFDHTGIVDNCASCHDGALAKGKPATGHVDTLADCGLCHTPSGFIPATFDHSAVSVNTRCDSCHGVTSTGKEKKTNPAHWATSFDCRSCHTTSTFLGATWKHDSNSAGNCDSCHSSSGGAKPKPSSGHISTNLQCDACHTTIAWAPTNFAHDPQGNYPGDHRINFTCNRCHGNIITTPFVYPFSTYAPDCAACHKNDFEPESDHNGGKSGTVAQNQDCSGGGRGCHKVSDSGF